ncbi:hypothetical protein BIW12_03995 [Flavobacterium commune]|uniref:Uncharacterized protein n=1 Tax=Flavobacterium commune TaxID=1306519 RepID=A0A1D9P7V5_9FLAO|nr:hypothetical protein BIW12_03995 [Flavobacterium commune]
MKYIGLKTDKYHVYFDVSYYFVEINKMLFLKISDLQNFDKQQISNFESGSNNKSVILFKSLQDNYANS